MLYYSVIYVYFSTEIDLLCIPYFYFNFIIVFIAFFIDLLETSAGFLSVKSYSLGAKLWELLQ